MGSANTTQLIRHWVGGFYLGRCLHGPRVSLLALQELENRLELEEGMDGQVGWEGMGWSGVYRGGGLVWGGVAANNSSLCVV